MISYEIQYTLDIFFVKCLIIFLQRIVLLLFYSYNFSSEEYNPTVGEVKVKDSYKVF